MSVTARRVVRMAVAVAIVGWPLAADAQRPSPADLTIEELLRIEVQRVFGASERMQPVTQAPSSVTIVTADEIERFGYRTLADILRGVRGFYVSDDRNYSYVGVRGFATAGDYNTRILLLVNGHRVNDSVYDQASLGADLGIDPAMFERVEIIRGPASSLYGTNAFFAVVNVVTRGGASIDGAAVELTAGSLGAARARASAGRRLANGIDYAVSVSAERTDGLRRVYFPQFDAPETNRGVAEGLDAEQASSLYARVNFKDVTITAVHGQRDKDVPTASFGTLFNEHQFVERTHDLHTLVDAQYDGVYRGTRVMVRGAFDRYSYKGLYPYAAVTDGVAVAVNDDFGLGTRWGVNTALTRPLPGRQTLTIGSEFFDNLHQNQWGGYSDPAFAPYAMIHTSRQGAVYFQDEITLRPWLLVDAGLRHDKHSSFERTTPRGAVIVLPSPNQSFKYLYGRAFRAPNAYERFFYTTTPADLRPESIDTHEVVWEQYTGEWLRTSVSGYWYDATDLLELTEVAVEGPTFNDQFQFANVGRARARGVELEGEVRLKSNVQALASYTRQRAVDRETDARLPNSPAHLGKLRITIPALRGRASLSFETQYVSRRTTIVGTSVASAAVAHLNVSAALTRSLDFEGVVNNLFDARYADPASDEHVPDAIPQNGRTFRVGLRWRVWTTR